MSSNKKKNLTSKILEKIKNEFMKDEVINEINNIFSPFYSSLYDKIVFHYLLFITSFLIIITLLSIILYNIIKS